MVEKFQASEAALENKEWLKIYSKKYLFIIINFQLYLKLHSFFFCRCLINLFCLTNQRCSSSIIFSVMILSARSLLVQF